jgi:hypothetical protein
MQFFIPEWAILEQKKILYGLIAIAYSLYEIHQGNIKPFTYLTYLFAGFLFTIILGSGIVMILKYERIAKHTGKIYLASAVLYLYLLNQAFQLM